METLDVSWKQKVKGEVVFEFHEKGKNKLKEVLPWKLIQWKINAMANKESWTFCMEKKHNKAILKFTPSLRKISLR